MQKTKPSIIITFGRFLLTLNIFAFSGVCYLKKGCVMGIIYAPNYAKLFMTWSEEQFIYPVYLQWWNIFKICPIYLRYIDEIFLIWNGIKEELDKFALKINNCHPITELEYHISKNQINFLVTTVSEFGNQLCTKYL